MLPENIRDIRRKICEGKKINTCVRTYAEYVQEDLNPLVGLKRWYKAGLLKINTE